MWLESAILWHRFFNFFEFTNKRLKKFFIRELYCIFVKFMKRIVAKRTLREFWEKHSDSEQYLKTWYETTKNSNWKTPRDVKTTYINVSILKNSRVVFNIKGNSYRLIVKFNYERQWAFIRFVGTHSEYDNRCKYNIRK